MPTTMGERNTVSSLTIVAPGAHRWIIAAKKPWLMMPGMTAPGSPSDLRELVVGEAREVHPGGGNEACAPSPARRPGGSRGVRRPVPRQRCASLSPPGLDLAEVDRGDLLVVLVHEVHAVNDEHHGAAAPGLGVDVGDLGAPGQAVTDPHRPVDLHRLAAVDAADLAQVGELASVSSSPGCCPGIREEGMRLEVGMRGVDVPRVGLAAGLGLLEHLLFQ